MTHELINQLNHLGFIISENPIEENEWKISIPSEENCYYTLEFIDKNIILYNNNNIVCNVQDNDAGHQLIIRSLPLLQGIEKNNKQPLNFLFDYCNAVTKEDQQKIIQLLNYRNINNLNIAGKREYASQIANSLVALGFKFKENNLSVVDVILQII
jgi:hypothetical protein